MKNKSGNDRGMKHGFGYHRLYKVWNGMIHRCYNEKRDSYKHYGARGVTVCERWHDIKNFIEDMEHTFKEGLQLDRINNNGNYEPSNCRWVTTSQNAKNKRNSVEEQSDIDYVTFNKRINKWNVRLVFDSKLEAEIFAAQHLERPIQWPLC